MKRKYTFEELWERLPIGIRKSCQECEQDPVWHPEGVVSEHIRLVFNYANENYFQDEILLLASIFHDIGKPETQKITNKGGNIRISNYGHENYASKYIDAYIHLFPEFYTKENKENFISTLKFICQNHMKMHLLNDKKIKKKHKIEILTNHKDFELLEKFSHCDDGGKNMCEKL
jgi:hypothetical protein